MRMFPGEHDHEVDAILVSFGVGNLLSLQFGDPRLTLFACLSTSFPIPSQLPYLAIPYRAGPHFVMPYQLVLVVLQYLALVCLFWPYLERQHLA